MKVVVHDCSLISSGTSKSSVRKLLSAVAHFAWYIQYRTRFLFFSRPDEDWSTTLLRLKNGLAKVLESFYPVAGRLFVREDGLLEADCCGDGVMFIEASANFALEDLPCEGGNFDLPPVLLMDLAQTGGHVLKWPWSSDAPLFFIQVTRFSCGGLCISVKFNHQVMDGTSAWHFVKSWAESCCGRDISVPPTFQDTPINIAPTKDEDLPVPVCMNVYKCMDLLPPARVVTDLQTRCFIFSKEVIKQLKQESPGGFSTFQLLTAHAWGKITAARNLEETETTGLLFAVNCRTRLSTLGPSYGGQGALIMRATATAGQVKKDDGVELLKKAIEEVTEVKVREVMKLVEAYALDKEHTVFTKLVSGRDLVVGSSFYFPVYEDFGFGKPVGMSITPTMSDGRLYYFPGRDQGSVALYVTLKSDVMFRLLSDPSFVGN